jgi:hypothetical protein
VEGVEESGVTLADWCPVCPGSELIKTHAFTKSGVEVAFTTASEMR